MSSKNVNRGLNSRHFEEAKEAVANNRTALEKSGDTILVLEDGTRILVIFRKDSYYYQYLDALL